MATTIEERILDLVKTKLEGITTGAGYQQTVAKVSRASRPDAPMEFGTSDLPGIQIRHVQTGSSPHLRGAIECVAEIDLICCVVPDAADENISRLMADVQKVLNANKRWDAGGGTFLARRTWIGIPEKDETETTEDIATGCVPFAILFRVDAADHYAVKEI